jgi:threonine dehydrogenase-like Zn-dependent dehydrogenase
MALALAAIEPRGTIVVKSTYANPLTIDMSQLVVNEISLVGSRCGDLGKAISWMVDNGEEFDLHLKNDKVHAFALSEYQQAFDEAANTGLEKVIFNQFDR